MAESYLTPPANFGENGSRYPHQSAFLMRKPENGGSAFSESRALGRVGERAQRFRIENQRFGHDLRARRISDLDEGPSCSSS